MKGKFFYFAAAALTLASCAQEEIVEQSSDKNAINFAVTTGAISRAANPYCNTNLPGSFNVAAAEAGTNNLYFENDKVTMSEGRWVSSTQRYWPMYNLDFHAWVDDDNTYDYNGGNPQFQNFTVKNDAAQQLDLMYAVMNNQSRQTVKLNFRHALSQVVFKAVNNSALDITVQEVKVGHLYNQGTYTFPTENTDENYENHDELPNGTEGDLTRGTWGINENGGAVNEYSTGSFNVELSNQVQNLTVANHLGGQDQSLILLPQTQKAWDPTQKGVSYNGSYFMLKLVIKQDNKTVYDGYSVIPASIEWNQGIRYIYTFRFTADGTGGYTPNPNDPLPIISGITYDVTTDDFIPVGPIDTPDPSQGGTEEPVYKTATVVINNGNDATPATQTLSGRSVNDVVKVNLPTIAPTRPDYEFVNWTDAEGNVYLPGGFVSAKDGETVNLTANWNKVVNNITYRINFLANPFSAFPELEVTGMPNPAYLEVEVPETEESHTFTIPSVTPAYGNFVFMGWGIQQVNYADDPAWKEGAKFTVTKEKPVVDLYAIWGTKFTGGSTPGAGGSEW